MIKKKSSDYDLDYNIVKVIAGDRCKTFYCHQEYDQPIKLETCREWFSDSNMLIVIAENEFDGAVFRFGNHGPYWEEVGTTQGYA